MRAKLRDFLVLFLCLLILAASSYYLYLDFNAKPETRGEEKQGYITFKYKVAQRKFPSRMIWDDVEQMLPIYNKDSVRTDSNSEAIVTLNNGVKIELDPDSMFVLNIEGKKIEIEIKKGSFSVSTTKSLLNYKDFSLKSQNIELFFNDAKGEFFVSKNEESFEIVSRKGNTGISSGKQKESIFEKQKANLNTLNETFTKIDLNYFDMKPEPNARYFVKTDSKEVIFEWKEKIGVEIEIEICQNPSFKEKLITLSSKDNTISNKFKEGIYFWRLKTSTAEISEVRKFRIIQDPPLKLISPNDKIQFKSETGESLVYFFWSKRELALSYHFEVANDDSFKNIIFSRNAFKANISIPFGIGEYFWRVRAFDSIPGATPVSQIFSFKIEKDNGSVAFDSSSNSDEESGLISYPVKTANTSRIPTATETKEVSENQIPSDTKELPQIPILAETKEATKNPNLTENKDLPPKKIANPQLLFPRANSTVDMNKLDSLHFKWNKVSGAKSYTLKFSQQGSTSVILETEVIANSYNFTQLEKLDVGNFVWTVKANSGIDDAEVGSSTAKFNITLGEQPAAPETISKGKKEE